MTPMVFDIKAIQIGVFSAFYSKINPWVSLLESESGFEIVTQL
jgi:hypothetical protein